jgi:tetratricopeptide (TPR) repeat protein
MYAIQMFKAGRLDEAKYWFEQALAIDPNYDPAIQNYKVVLEQLRQKGK